MVFSWFFNLYAVSLHPQQVRERGVIPRLSRSCKQPIGGVNTMSLILLGRRSQPGRKSEYLPAVPFVLLCLWG
jgi:hypothetical protein